MGRGWTFFRGKIGFIIRDPESSEEHIESVYYYIISFHSHLPTLPSTFTFHLHLRWRFFFLSQNATGFLSNDKKKS